MNVRRIVSTMLFLALLISQIATAQPAAHAAATLTNPGFESGPGQTPAGWSTWSSNGTESADYQEAGGRSGTYRLSHWSSSAYVVSTWQYLSGMSNGAYLLRAWVRSSGGQRESFLALRDCGTSEQRVNIPVSAAWVQIALPITVSNGQCTIIIYSDANAGNWINVDDLTFGLAGSSTARLTILGADVSSLKKSEDKGGTYAYANGTSGDALQILKDSGVNYVRFKVWVNPADGYNNRARVLQMAARAKAKGLKILIDFHYSDSWADPGTQTKPAAWQSYNFTQLKQAVYNHTYDVCNSLKAQGTTPDMVQVGNEINTGMLWPDGNSSNWTNLADLLKQGISAVRACSSSTLVMLHLAKGGDNAGSRWWFDSAVARGVSFDVMGFSYYSYWHGTLADLQTNLNDMVARYNKPVVVVETAYPFTLGDDDGYENIINLSSELTAGYAASSAGQASNLRDVMSIVRAVPNGRGLGVFYWEAPWTGVPGNGWDPYTPSSGNGWDNQALFDFNNRALPAMSEFRP